MERHLGAVEREEEAWDALEGRLPGMNGCSQTLWSAWMDAVAQLRAEAERRIHGNHPTDLPNDTQMHANRLSAHA